PLRRRLSLVSLSQPPGGKPLRTFPGVALLFHRNPRAEYRCALFLGLPSYSIATPGRQTAAHFSSACRLIPSRPPGGRPLRSSPGLALLSHRNPRAENRCALSLGLPSSSIAPPGRKTAAHFPWGCPLIPSQPPGGKPLRTFPGVA